MSAPSSIVGKSTNSPVCNATSEGVLQLPQLASKLSVGLGAAKVEVIVGSDTAGAPVVHPAKTNVTKQADQAKQVGITTFAKCRYTKTLLNPVHDPQTQVTQMTYLSPSEFARSWLAGVTDAAGGRVGGSALQNARPVHRNRRTHRTPSVVSVNSVDPWSDGPRNTTNASGIMVCNQYGITGRDWFAAWASRLVG